MSHPLIEQMFEMLEDAKNLDFAEAPSFKFMVLLRDKLVRDGFYAEDAETIVSSMEIEIDAGSATDEELNKLAELYSDILVKARQTVFDNFAYPMPVLLQLAKMFSIKLS